MSYTARNKSTGFTLIELMVTTAIVAILSAIAIGAYGNYIRSSKLSESFAMLGDYRLKMEQFKQDNRSYADSLNPNTCGIALPTSSKYFDFSCTIAAAGTQFTATAANKAGTGLGNAADYSYSIDQDGAQNTQKFAGSVGPNGSWKNK